MSSKTLKNYLGHLNPTLDALFKRRRAGQSKKFNPADGKIRFCSAPLGTTPLDDIIFFSFYNNTFIIIIIIIIIVIIIIIIIIIITVIQLLTLFTLINNTLQLHMLLTILKFA